MMEKTFDELMQTKFMQTTVDRKNEVESNKFDMQYRFRHIPFQVNCQIHSSPLELIDQQQLILLALKAAHR